ncbi:MULTISPECIES: toxin-antitoxin system HicB family antitoxin [Amycolatopsis]|uniref:Toxin-antitoxin system HicB family antitoxin n=1 Tax=Amycolatopsis albidoflavus TaxID=102226 RepID=A0ABW5IA67_9PSEU
MDLTPYIANLREDLANTASAGDEQTRRAAALLSSALEPAVRLTLMNALSDLAAEVTAALPGQVVDVRLDGRDVRVVVTGGEERSSSAPPPPPPAPPIDGGDISRITLRLVEQIKGQAEQAAAAQGVSLNTFVAQAVQGALGQAQQHQQRHQSWQDSGSGGGRTETKLHGWVEG